MLLETLNYIAEKLKLEGGALVLSAVEKAADSDPETNKIRLTTKLIQDFSLLCSILSAKSLAELDAIYAHSNESRVYSDIENYKNTPDSKTTPLPFHLALNQSLSLISNLYGLREDSECAPLFAYQQALLCLIVAHLGGKISPKEETPLPFDVLKSDDVYKFATAHGWLDTQASTPGKNTNAIQALLTQSVHYQENMHRLEGKQGPNADANERNRKQFIALLSSIHFLNDASNAFSDEFNLPFDQRLSLSLLAHFRKDKASEPLAALLQKIEQIEGADSIPIQYIEFLHCCLSEEYTKNGFMKDADPKSHTFTVQESLTRLLSTLLKDQDKVSQAINQALNQATDLPLNQRLLLALLTYLSNEDISTVRPVIDKLTRIEDEKEVLATFFYCCFSKEYLHQFINAPETTRGPSLKEKVTQFFKKAITSFTHEAISTIAIAFTLLTMISAAMTSFVLYLTLNISLKVLALYFSSFTLTALGVEYLCFYCVFRLKQSSNLKNVLQDFEKDVLTTVNFTDIPPSYSETVTPSRSPA